jgi:cyclopropane fatty-acyl-phospholipid synthase-like methyltransferase
VSLRSEPQAEDSAEPLSPKGGRLLDVGSGAGEFLYHAERLGVDS